MIGCYPTGRGWFGGKDRSHLRDVLAFAPTPQTMRKMFCSSLPKEASVVPKCINTHLTCHLSHHHHLSSYSPPPPSTSRERGLPPADARFPPRVSAMASCGTNISPISPSASSPMSDGCPIVCSTTPPTAKDLSLPGQYSGSHTLSLTHSLCTTNNTTSLDIVPRNPCNVLAEAGWFQSLSPLCHGSPRAASSAPLSTSRRMPMATITTTTSSSSSCPSSPLGRGTATSPPGGSNGSLGKEKAQKVSGLTVSAHGALLLGSEPSHDTIECARRTIWVGLQDTQEKTRVRRQTQLERYFGSCGPIEGIWLPRRKERVFMFHAWIVFATQHAALRALALGGTVQHGTHTKVCLEAGCFALLPPLLALPWALPWTNPWNGRQHHRPVSPLGPHRPIRPSMVEQLPSLSHNQHAPNGFPSAARAQAQVQVQAQSQANTSRLLEAHHCSPSSSPVLVRTSPSHQAHRWPCSQRLHPPRPSCPSQSFSSDSLHPNLPGALYASSDAHETQWIRNPPRASTPCAWPLSPYHHDSHRKHPPPPPPPQHYYQAGNTAHGPDNHPFLPCTIANTQGSGPWSRHTATTPSGLCSDTDLCSVQNGKSASRRSRSRRNTSGDTEVNCRTIALTPHQAFAMFPPMIAAATWPAAGMGAPFSRPFDLAAPWRTAPAESVPFGTTITHTPSPSSASTASRPSSMSFMGGSSQGYQPSPMPCPAPPPSAQQGGLGSLCAPPPPPPPPLQPHDPGNTHIPQHAEMFSYPGSYLPYHGFPLYEHLHHHPYSHEHHRQLHYHGIPPLTSHLTTCFNRTPTSIPVPIPFPTPPSGSYLSPFVVPDSVHLENHPFLAHRYGLGA